MKPRNKLIFAYFPIVIVLAFGALILALSGCDGCIMGEASEACIMRSVYATETSAAREFHIQLTEAAR